MANPARRLFTSLKFPAQVVLGGGLITVGQMSIYPHAGANYWDRGRATLSNSSVNMLRAGWTQPIRLYRIHLEWVGGAMPEAISVRYSSGEFLWEACRGGSGGAQPWGVLDLDFAPFGISAPQTTSTQVVFFSVGAASCNVSWNILYCIDSVTVSND